MLRKTFIYLPLLVCIALTTTSFKKKPTKGRGRAISCSSCSHKFVDGVDKHREVTKYSSLKTPAKNFSAIQTYVADSQLAKLGNGEGYMLAKMTYSYPYLTVKAVDFVDQLGSAYRAACARKGVPYRPFIITSALRTQESVARLTRVNRNAIPESAHLYGTTFDISWCRFGGTQAPSQKNLNVLVEVLEDLREAQACYVKFERQQACFHITVNEAKTESIVKN